MSNTRIAILIDGGFFLQRYKHNNSGNSPRISDMKPFIDDIVNKVDSVDPKTTTNILLRTYYYDCRPFGDIKKDPNGNDIDFSKKPQFHAATKFQNDLKSFPQLALRLGDLSFDGWKIDKNDSSKFHPDLKQKAVDMKIGLDIAWMSSKRTIDKIVLVAGDSDFIAPMKFARREGILVYLDTMNQKKIKQSLIEHADFII